MNENIGGNIKILAQILGWLCLIGGIITAIVFWSDRWLSDLGWIPLVSGVVMFLSSWILYGFGQLVEDVHEIRNKPVQTAEAPVVVDELPEL